jgi:hypothetical protein
MSIHQVALPLAVVLSLLLSGCVSGTSSSVTYGGVTYTCNGETNCCCNAPIQHNNPGAGSWPDCSTGYTCKGLQPGGVVVPGIGRVDVNVCQKNTAPASAPLAIASTQPSYCRVDIP